MSVASATGSQAARPKKTPPTPKARPTGGTFVGLDIGSQLIKVVEVRGFKNNLNVTAMGVADTPPGTIQGGIITDAKALGSAIKSLLAKSGVRSRRVVSSVAGADGVVVRVIEVAAMPANELKAMMGYEVERYIPFSVNDVQMDFQPIDPDAVTNNPDGATMEVLLAVARNDMLAMHLNTLQAAGLTPVAIDVEPLAVGRALLDLNKSNNFASKNVVIVNIGATMTDVGVYKKGVLRFPRTIPIAGENFTRAIADHLGLSLEQAEEEKRQHATVLMDMLSASGPGFGETSSEPSPFDFDFDESASGASGPPDLQSGVFNPYGNAPEEDTLDSTKPNTPPVVVPSSVGTDLAADDPRSRRRREVFDALLPQLQEFVMEVRRSVDYFRSRYPSETVDQIILCGGSAKIGNLDRYMEYDLGVPAVVGDPLANATVIARNRNSELSPAFAVALGLAARDAVVGL